MAYVQHDRQQVGTGFNNLGDLSNSGMSFFFIAFEAKVKI